MPSPFLTAKDTGNALDAPSDGPDACEQFPRLGLCGSAEAGYSSAPQDWRARRDSNPRPVDYESTALRASASHRPGKRSRAKAEAPLSYGRADSTTPSAISEWIRTGGKICPASPRNRLFSPKAYFVPLGLRTQLSGKVWTYRGTAVNVCRVWKKLKPVENSEAANARPNERDR
jgi:hypothetical protein